MANGGVTDDRTLSVRGAFGDRWAGANLAAGETLRVYDGDTYLGNASVTVVAGGQSTWSFGDPRKLSHGQTVNYNVAVADAALNETAHSASYSATVDTSGTLNLGVVAGINLNLINKITTNMNYTYYYLDNSGDGVASSADQINHNLLDNLLNNGVDTKAVDSFAMVAGVDNERSIVINGHTLVLATTGELNAIWSDGNVIPPGWASGNYWSANWSNMTFSNQHEAVNLVNNAIHHTIADSNALWVCFRVM